MSIFCPECETAVPLPDKLVAAGVEKIRCRNCGTRFCVLPGGHTVVLNAGTTGGTLQPGSGGQPPSSGVAFGSDGDTPASPTPGGAGPDLPNLTGAIGHDQQAAILAAAQGDQLVGYPKLPVGTVFRQKYRIEAEIGHGASAVVYRARDVDADIDVALKVVGMVGGQADSIRRAWAEEYKARRQVSDGTHLLNLESPQVEEIDGTTYVALAQELGQSTLRDWLKKNKHAIAEHREEAMSLFGQICRGVEALHKQNLAHLDLKPENIILVKKGKEELVAKVGDFGLARAAGSLTRREGAGTPAYMAPEQVRSAREKDIGPWSDIYALGCILFELLDGDAPFSGSTAELKDKHLTMPPPELADTPAHLEQLAMACLAKTRKQRPQTVAELRKTIETNPEEEQAFEQAGKRNSEAAWEAFLQKWGDGRHAEEARTALEKCADERKARERAEAERKAKEEAEKKAQERAEAERRKQEERERRAREEADRKTREEADKEARQQAEEARRREQRRVFEPVDIHGWDADRVQERQRKQAEALGLSVIFRDTLADGSPGPEMVLIPSGIYLMGSPADEPERIEDEGPQHQITIPKPFAIGRYALTFAEWDVYADKTDGYRPEDEGWGRGARPVIKVSWEDAQGYLRWLSSQTGQEYRLPSESEWEYACRSGTTMRFNTGNCITTDQANFRGTTPAQGCPVGISRNETTPVGSFSPNAFGLYDTHGNVWEWVQDCWNTNYEGAPTNGSVWEKGDCSRAVLRGGPWIIGGSRQRSASRNWDTRSGRYATVGFRVTRSVDP